MAITLKKEETKEEIPNVFDDLPQEEDDQVEVESTDSAQASSAQSLVVVESPAKMATVGKILGPNYLVKASLGHIRDLSPTAFGVDVENNFQPQYVEVKMGKKNKNLSELKSAARNRNVKNIYLASDPDREGEAIAWHLKEVLSKVNDSAKFYRVTYNQITKSAIEKAFQHPGEINMALVNSQQARRVIDRIVGYKISPLLWTRIERKISAGRVQSVAERLICEREREIQGFQPKEYWNFMADFQAGDPCNDVDADHTFSTKLTDIDGKGIDECSVDNEKAATAILNDIKAISNWKVLKVENAKRKQNPKPPYITSTLQQAASSALGFHATKTLKIAQQLYEGIDCGHGAAGLITYMRTDSVKVAPEAQQAAKEFITEKYGKEYAPEKANEYKSKGNAQEAHEAIRPTDVTLEPQSVKQYLDSDQMKLYDLIWRRFVASQMASADTVQTKVDVVGSSAGGKDKPHEYQFHATSNVVVFPGYLKVYDIKDDDTVEENIHNSQVLDSLKDGEECSMLDALDEQKFTEPKPRYTEATLIRELESNGIGRPSTYALIIETIINRGYAVREKGKLVPTERGFKVNDYLVLHLPELFQVGFTASMEDSLDDIGSGKTEWTDVLDGFYKKFSVWLKDAKVAGAPKNDNPSVLAEEIHKVIHWEKPEHASGKRGFDDRKFFASIEAKLQRDNIISDRQWEALLALALKYEADLPDLRDLAKEHGFDKELAVAEDKRNKENKARQERQALQAERAKLAPSQDGLAEVFESMENVPWAEPERRRGTPFNDAKFFESLRSQSESGKALSEKQIASLNKLVERYKEHIPHVKNILKILAAKLPPVDAAAAEQANELGKKYLAAFQTVKTWSEPVKRGSREFSNEDFVKSIQKHLDSGRTLSEKQLGALRRLAAKYNLAVDDPTVVTEVKK